MTEKIDPYFEERLQQGRNHRIVKTIEINVASLPEVEANKELPPPALEGAIEDFGWSEKSVDNIIDALETGKIKIKFLESNRIRIEFCFLEKLPAQLGHVSELEIIKQNLKDGAIFGSPQSDQFTYLQTTDFAVEGYMDDESEGKEYGRVYVDSQKLSGKRNVYIDPECLHITDYEYGFSYCVKGGVPAEAIIRIEVIKAKKLPRKQVDIDMSDWPDDVDLEMKKQAERLKEHLKTKLK